MIGELTTLARSVADRGGDPVEAGLWSAVIDNDLGLAGHCAILAELGLAGRGYRDGIAVGAEALSRFGSEDWLAPVLAGKTRVAVAWHRSGDGWDLVTDGMTADLFLMASGSEVLVVPHDRVGREPESSVDAVDARVGLTGEPIARLDCLDWMRRQRTVAICAEQVGVLRAAVALTARYAREREQFGRPIGAFQAVSQRLADAWIDLRAAELTLAEAVSSPSDNSVATAAYWAAEAGHRVAHTCVHVHGGTGIDVSHPAHRYFAGLKRLEFELGGATAQLRALADAG